MYRVLSFRVLGVQSLYNIVLLFIALGVQSLYNRVLSFIVLGVQILYKRGVVIYNTKCIEFIVWDKYTGLYINIFFNLSLRTTN
jgi:hypothetical protein